MSYTSIGNAIAEMIDEITEVKVVYNYAARDFADFPAAVVRMTGHNNLFQTTAANNRTYVFEVDVLYKTASPSDAEGIMRTVADLIITKIESDVSLRGACHIARPSRGQISFVAEPIPMQVLTITIEASKHINR